MILTGFVIEMDKMIWKPTNRIHVNSNLLSSSLRHFLIRKNYQYIWVKSPNWEMISRMIIYRLQVFNAVTIFGFSNIHKLTLLTKSHLIKIDTEICFLLFSMTFILIEWQFSPPPHPHHLKVCSYTRNGACLGAILWSMSTPGTPTRP